ncbi:hypothetical protein [Achromobacter anxifer]|uniref:hypothetical protein n=1 Tax=Achromobacter anxifer TaxID=1287737 RepID=UPI0023F90671|nr:hypothetical protein [Achromobacter anxifer]MDF8361291.1 hypothetical protein [Achromobacter anxifer]
MHRAFNRPLLQLTLMHGLISAFICSASHKSENLLGMGWSFGLNGVAALVLKYKRSEEKTKVQSLKDFIVFSTMAVGSFAAGSLLAACDEFTVLVGGVRSPCYTSDRPVCQVQREQAQCCRPWADVRGASCRPAARATASEYAAKAAHLDFRIRIEVLPC